MSRRTAPAVLALVVGLALATAARADWPRRSDHPESTRAVLVVISRPWSNVKVDGRRLGPTPVRIELEPGRHRLELRSGDGRIFRDRITVRAGETRRVMHRFSR